MCVSDKGTVPGVHSHLVAEPFWQHRHVSARQTNTPIHSTAAPADMLSPRHFNMKWKRWRDSQQSKISQSICTFSLIWWKVKPPINFVQRLVRKANEMSNLCGRQLQKKLSIYIRHCMLTWKHSNGNFEHKPHQISQDCSEMHIPALRRNIYAINAFRVKLNKDSLSVLEAVCMPYIV